MTPEEIKKHVIREIKTFPKTYKVINDNSDESYITCEVRLDGGVNGKLKIQILTNDGNKVELIEEIDDSSILYRNPYRKIIQDDLLYFQNEVNKLFVTT